MGRTFWWWVSECSFIGQPARLVSAGPQQGPHWTFSDLSFITLWFCRLAMVEIPFAMARKRSVSVGGVSPFTVSSQMGSLILPTPKGSVAENATFFFLCVDADAL